MPRPIDADALNMHLADIQLANRGWKDEFCDILDEIMEIVNEAPTIETAHTLQWVPMAVSPPKEKGGYIVCTDRGGVLLAYWYGTKWGGGYAAKHITHWMQRPAPPKEGKK